MSDKLSSPSSSSGYSPRTRGSASSDESSFITVRKHPPTYVYSNESFEVQLQLETPTPKAGSPSAASSQPIELGASLHHVKSGRECTSETILITEPSRIDLSRNKKTCTIKCMIRMDGIRGDQGAALELRFAPKEDLSPSARSVIGASTKPITIVNYKVKISLEEEWENIWYKDEGGRDKCMELFVAIYDKDGQIRTGEQIPLQPLLCYASEDGSPVKVSNQEVLRTLGSSKVYIDKDSGKARIRFRVEDVSKNHQGQDFKLQVGPDPKAKLFKDIAPDYTPPVNVRSKRNKRSRSQSGGGRAGGERKISSPMASRARYDGPPHDVSLERSDLSALRDSMKSVLHWADEVVNGLYPLQWQVMGYAQHPDGTPDYSSPYHNMPNPNGCINRILSLYSDSVRENLRLISNAIDSTDGARPPEQPYLPLPGALPPSDDPYGMMRGQPGPMSHAQVGLPTQSVNRRPGPGMLPPIGQETFRDKPEGPMPPFQARGQMPPMHHPSSMGSVPIQGRQMGGPGAFMDPMHQNQAQHSRMMPQHQQAVNLPGMHMHPDVLNESSMESEVAYVLAKQYKAARTGERLGFPAYSANKEIVGFYREANGKVGVGSFHPLSRHRNDFGPLEVLQANDILERAITKKSDAVHALKDWGTMANLLDHALVYDWSKDISGDPSNSSSE